MGDQKNRRRRRRTAARSVAEPTEILSVRSLRIGPSFGHAALPGGGGCCVWFGLRGFSRTAQAASLTRGFEFEIACRPDFG